MVFRIGIEDIYRDKIGSLRKTAIDKAGRILKMLHRCKVIATPCAGSCLCRMARGTLSHISTVSTTRIFGACYRCILVPKLINRRCFRIIAHSTNVGKNTILGAGRSCSNLFHIVMRDQGNGLLLNSAASRAGKGLLTLFRTCRFSCYFRCEIMPKGRDVFSS